MLERTINPAKIYSGTSGSWEANQQVSRVIFFEVMLTFLGQENQVRLLFCVNIELYTQATQPNSNQSIFTFLICTACSVFCFYLFN